VGFPGETEDDFRELCDFVGRVRFDRLGVFIFSREEGTKAAKMKGQLPVKVKRERAAIIMELQDAINIEKNNLRIGKFDDIMIDGLSGDGFYYYGRTYGEAPDIDWVVYCKSGEKPETGDIIRAEILAIQ
jgi:ribosomal protein S12 methylthiotransferase